MPEPCPGSGAVVLGDPMRSYGGGERTFCGGCAGMVRTVNRSDPYRPERYIHHERDVAGYVAQEER